MKGFVEFTCSLCSYARTLFIANRRVKMLQLKRIFKNYVIGDMEQHVLKGVDINFRENEFVSILGPSGSGKTTLLNIIGGIRSLFHIKRCWRMLNLR